MKKSFNGFHYFVLGWKLILTPGIKRFVFFPFLINILIMIGAIWWMFSHFNIWTNRLMLYIPDWLHWLSYLLWPLIILLILLFWGFCFGMLTNWIAAPFNGLLAERIEAKLTNTSLPEGSISNVLRDMPRVIRRELEKFFYHVPRLLLLLLFSLVPVIGPMLAPILLFLFSAWVLAIQYCDYPFDNHRISFVTMRRALQKHRMYHLQFGGIVSLFMLVPGLNMIVMPAAVCGATAMWVDYYRGRI